MDPAFYPISQIKVTRNTYLQEVDAYHPEAIAKNPNRGVSGPQIFIPILAKYVQTFDSRWFWQFEHPAALIPLYRKHLIAGGAMTGDVADLLPESTRLG